MNPKDSVGAKKAPLRYVPSALVIGASEAMNVGQAKYGPFNWRKQPVSAMTYAEAVERHLAAWKDGQDDAEDTGINPWKHIAAGAAIVLDAMGIEGGLLDDRPDAGPAADLLRQLDKSLVTPERAKEMVQFDEVGSTSIQELIRAHEERIKPERDSYYAQVQDIIYRVGLPSWRSDRLSVYTAMEMLGIDPVEAKLAMNRSVGQAMQSAAELPQPMSNGDGDPETAEWATRSVPAGDEEGKVTAYWVEVWGAGDGDIIDVKLIPVIE